jgi:hypothetical protein
MQDGALAQLQDFAIIHFFIFNNSLNQTINILEAILIKP